MKYKKHLHNISVPALAFAIFIGINCISFTCINASPAATQNFIPDFVLSPEYPDYGSDGWQRNTTGNQKILVIPVMFSDVKNSTNIASLNSTLKNLTDYYYNVSYGKLNLSYEIVDRITLSKPMAFYGADGGFENTTYKRIDKLNVMYNQFANDTIRAVDSKINFSKYDHVIILHAGNDQANDPECGDCIWSMRLPYVGVETNDSCITYSNGVFCDNVDYAIVVSETDTFGVYAHEFGHELGLPDLYDTNNGSSVVGAYELMDSGAWFNAHPGAFSKSKLNFVDEIVIYNETINLTVFPAENKDTIVKILRGSHDSWQYYLIEMRKKIGYDANLPISYPDNALLVWKIDESWPDNKVSRHKPMVELLLFNESGNFQDEDGGIFINFTLNLNNVTLSVSQIPTNLNITNRILDNDIVKPETCKSLDIYAGWPENNPQTFIFAENETDYFTLNDKKVIVWAKIMGNVNDTFTFEFINTSNGINKFYKNISVTITKNISRNIYNYWNWFIDTSNISFKINSSVTENWSVKILVDGVYTNHSLNLTISDKMDTKPPKVNLLPPQNITENTALILWNASDTGINASGLKKYKIYYYDADTVFGIYNLTHTIDKKEEVNEFMNRTFYGTPGHTYCFWVEAYDRAGNYGVSNTECVILLTVCNCSTCDECNTQLNNATCNIVYLKTNIINYSETCINSLNFSNKIFDCREHTIDGDDSGGDYGIYLNNNQNNTIRNCIISDFHRGIYLVDSNNNNLINNTLISNTWSGSCLWNSDNNTFISNLITSNAWGIRFRLDSNSNNLIQNRICGNPSNDVNDLGSNPAGSNNTCNNTNGWGDNNITPGTTGCMNKCVVEKATDIFDAVEMLEYLSGEKNLSRGTDYYNLNNDKIVNLPDVLALIAQIVT